MSKNWSWCNYVPIYSLVLLWTFFACLKLLLDFVRHPVQFFQRPKKRSTPPQCLLDESLGRHEYVKANGIKFHCVTSGEKSKPLMLFLHGFPEFWYSWRYQIREFSADYHVVAVDLRGYGETDHPPKTSDYTRAKLCQDIAELIPALGHSSTILVAHDWGGVIAWEVAEKHPELVEKLIIMNIPHPAVYRKVLFKSAAQLMKSWYLFLFQVPWLPEFIFSRRDYGFFHVVFRGKKGGIRNLDRMSVKDVEAFKYVFSQPGALTGPINYYRCMFSMTSIEEASKPIENFKIPTLVIWGDEDLFLEPSLADAHSKIVQDLTVKHIPKCSHWIQQDCPELVNQYIEEFV